jgi:hypothetical protein
MKRKTGKGTTSFKCSQPFRTVGTVFQEYPKQSEFPRITVSSFPHPSRITQPSPIHIDRHCNAWPTLLCAPSRTIPVMHSESFRLSRVKCLCYSPRSIQVCVTCCWRCIAVVLTHVHHLNALRCHCNRMVEGLTSRQDGCLSSHVC